MISIIVPVYKTEKYLDRCVESILKQTFTDLELILVDDGSPDNCPAMCDEYAEKDSRVRVIHKENGGVSSARNAGLDVAGGGISPLLTVMTGFIRKCWKSCINRLSEQMPDTLPVK